MTGNGRTRPARSAAVSIADQTLGAPGRRHLHVGDRRVGERAADKRDMGQAGAFEVIDVLRLPSQDAAVLSSS